MVGQRWRSRSRHGNTATGERERKWDEVWYVKLLLLLPLPPGHARITMIILPQLPPKLKLYVGTGR